jgi:hypothetical protein
VEGRRPSPRAAGSPSNWVTQAPGALRAGSVSRGHRPRGCAASQRSSAQGEHEETASSREHADITLRNPDSRVLSRDSRNQPLRALALVLPAEAALYLQLPPLTSRESRRVSHVPSLRRGQLRCRGQLHTTASALFLRRRRGSCLYDGIANCNLQPPIAEAAGAGAGAGAAAAAADVSLREVGIPVQMPRRQCRFCTQLSAEFLSRTCTLWRSSTIADMTGGICTFRLQRHACTLQVSFACRIYTVDASSEYSWHINTITHCIFGICTPKCLFRAHKCIYTLAPHSAASPHLSISASSSHLSAFDTNSSSRSAVLP